MNFINHVKLFIYSKQSLLDANENINVFMKTWLIHKNRQQYTDVDFEPDLPTPLCSDILFCFLDLNLKGMLFIFIFGAILKHVCFRTLLLFGKNGLPIVQQ